MSTELDYKLDLISCFHMLIFFCKRNGHITKSSFFFFFLVEYCNNIALLLSYIELNLYHPNQISVWRPGVLSHYHFLLLFVSLLQFNCIWKILFYFFFATCNVMPLASKIFFVCRFKHNQIFFCLIFYSKYIWLFQGFFSWLLNESFNISWTRIHRHNRQIHQQQIANSKKKICWFVQNFYNIIRLLLSTAKTAEKMNEWWHIFLWIL